MSTNTRLSPTTRRVALGTVSLALLLAPLAAATPADAAVSYANCTALHKTYAHGVGKSGARDKVKGSGSPVTNFKVSTSIYNKAIKANGRLDADKDGVACEAH